MATTMAIADVRYLWSEVDRLKAQVQGLQAAEKVAVADNVKMKEYVASFVTHAQLDAALCTKMSQSSVAVQVDHLRQELLDILAKKADMEVVQAVHAQKLDISVFESSSWDLKKFRAVLEQGVHDLFATFAHQFETQVNSKLAIDDFNRIFNPEANGQKAAIDNAAAKITRMKEQLEALQEYVTGDQQRQVQIAEMNVSLLDLTRKQNASRNAVAHLGHSIEASRSQISVLETANSQLTAEMGTLREEITQFQAQVNTDRARHEEHQLKFKQEVQQLQAMSQQLVHGLDEIQKFTRDTLVKKMDVKLKQLSSDFHQQMEAASTIQLQHAKHVKQEIAKVNERVQDQMKKIAMLESSLRKSDAILNDVQEELRSVKGPLVTLATNLREENVAILEEIKRSQNESRDIMLDYQELLEKDQQSYHTRLPSRPSTSGSSTSAATYTSRKHKQQMLLSVRSANKQRPHTSEGRPRAPINVTAPARVPMISCTSSTNKTQATSSPLRAQTAGAKYRSIPFSPQLDQKSDNNTSESDVDNPSSRKKFQRTILAQQEREGDSDELFYFTSYNSPALKDPALIGSWEGDS